ncbi:hypothetical protein V6R21_06875 [Limibacter armeniacum]|uniref:hypothetical protein n=1 Tax=Limibacter armeniacum TaxID=466084 RepID=UPI002FE533F0
MTGEKNTKYQIQQRTPIPYSITLSGGKQQDAYWYQLKNNAWVFGYYTEVKKAEKVPYQIFQNRLNQLIQFTNNNSKVRVERNDFRKLALAFGSTQESEPPLDLELLGEKYSHGLKGSTYEKEVGTFLRSIRFKPLTDAVEHRYNLPPGILLAMIMQESNGVAYLPNGTDDGGIGLCHMQPQIAQEFSLKTLDNNHEMVDYQHGKKLRGLVEDYTRGQLLHHLSLTDDRFDHLKNLDAAGRMMATYMAAGANPAFGGPLRSAVARYAGKRNYQQYWDNLKYYMKLLYDPAFIEMAEIQFNLSNPEFVVYEKIYSNGGQAERYLLLWWNYMESNFQLAQYKKLEAFRPENSDDVIATYKRYMIK